MRLIDADIIDFSHNWWGGERRTPDEIIAIQPTVQCAVVLPCKVGDTIYGVFAKDVRSLHVTEIHLDGTGIYIYATEDYGKNILLREDDFGKNVFNNKKEAENAYHGVA